MRAWSRADYTIENIATQSILLKVLSMSGHLKEGTVIPYWLIGEAENFSLQYFKGDSIPIKSCTFSSDFRKKAIVLEALCDTKYEVRCERYEVNYTVRVTRNEVRDTRYEIRRDTT
jgi:hypothetical protein